jgi:hypothetical protein
MSNFLLWLSGVDREVLKRCPSERTKFIGVGGAVLTTSVLAATACTLTLANFIGIPWTVALPIGLLWGVAIMNLDRWLVASTKRQDTAWRTILMAIPRILLAVVIGLVIAEPLVLKVFDSEVNQRAVELQGEQRAEQNRKLNEQFAQIDVLKQQREELNATLRNLGNVNLETDAQYKKLDAELKELQRQFTEADNAVIGEQEGSSGSGVAGDGPAAAEKKRRRDSLAAQVVVKQGELNARRDQVLAESAETQGVERARLEEEIKKLDEQINELEDERRTFDATQLKANAVKPGVLDRMEALEDLTSNNGSLNAAHWTLRLFILALDSLPVLVKTLMLLGKPSLYDLELEEYERQQLEIERARTDALIRARTMETEVIVDEAQARRDLEVQAARDLAFEVVEAQKDLARRYIAVWKERAAEQMEQAIEQHERIDVRQAPGRRDPRDAPASRAAKTSSTRGASGGRRPPGTGGGSGPASTHRNGSTSRQARPGRESAKGFTARQDPESPPLPPFSTR